MLELVNISRLEPGMFIVKVTEQVGKISVTTAGKISNQQNITALAKKGILQVQVDLSKSTRIILDEDEGTLEETYVNASGLTYAQQLEHTLKLYDQVKTIQGRLIKQVAKGNLNNVDEIDNVIQDIVEQAFDSDDAIGIAILLKESDEYFLEHSINCAILMVMFGRSLGIERVTLQHLGVGALLMDIGMLKLPLLLTSKSSALSEKEIQKVQQHVDVSLQLLESVDGIDDVSLTVIQQHHERLDGSGYLDGLREQQISLYGKMIAIVDTYDSLITRRPYREALKPTDALKKMQSEECGLDKELTNQFISCLGINPVGSLVKLNSGKIAMVMRVNKHFPISPTVMVFYNSITRLDEVFQLDLSTVEDKIVGSVSPGDFNLGLSDFLRQSFFNQ
jgi:HD-GYP domain-containing protein (c-di-GMP phosphodiesterase class II)